MKNKGLLITLIVLLLIITLFLTGILVILITGKGYSGLGGMIRIGTTAAEMKVQKEETYDISELKDIKLDLASIDITFKNSQDNQLKVVQKAGYEMKEEEKFSIKKTGDSITITENRKPKFIIFGFHSFSQLEIYIPESYKESLEITGASSDITLMEAMHLKDVRFKTSSGEVKIAGNMDCQNIEIKTTSGDIAAGVINANKIKLSTVSGEIKGQEIVSPTEVQISSTSGDIEIEKLQADNGSKISSVSGDVELTSFLGFGEIKTTSGSIQLKQFKMQGETSCKTVSGSIKLGMHPESNCDIYEKTVSGSVNISNEVRRIGTDPYFKLEVKTTSGSITINKI